MPPEIIAFTAAVRRTLFAAARKANTRLRTDPSRWCNLPGYVSHAKRWLIEHGIAAVPADKDGTFVLLTRSMLNDMVGKELAKPIYHRVAEDTFEQDFPRVVKAAHIAVKMLDDLGEKKMAK